MPSEINEKKVLKTWEFWIVRSTLSAQLSFKNTSVYSKSETTATSNITNLYSCEMRILADTA